LSLKDTINEQMRGAMKSKDTLRVGCLRLVMSAIKNREIEKRGELEEAELTKVLAQLAKQRREAIEMYEKGGRQELVNKEKGELEIINSFLPKQLSGEELAKLIDEAISEVGASGPRDMGKVMKVLAPKTAGRADGKEVSEAVKQRLAGEQA
jgi:uncharacterized protein YqeY